MLEFPEVINLSEQLRQYAAGRTVSKVLPPTKPHKFCWFNGDVNDYEKRIAGSKVIDVHGFGMFVEMVFDNGEKLCLTDGVNVRLLHDAEIPKSYQLLIKMEEERSLVFTVAMYGGLVLHTDDYDNAYYIKSKNAVSPFDGGFKSYFDTLFMSSKKTLSVKAFLATEQRFPGLGNGVLQDILFTAGIHPKRKIETLSDNEKDTLFHAVIDMLKVMTEKGGRNTEKDLYGNSCGYKTILCKNTLSLPCPICGGVIQKEAYLGGAVYYCPDCQK